VERRIGESDVTTRAGGVFVGTIAKFASATETRPRMGYPGAVYVNAVVIGNTPPIYKNQGYYVAGSVFEEWISVGAPNTFPPSAHTLADVQHVQLEE
jgi:hypothetical protein